MPDHSALLAYTDSNWTKKDNATLKVEKRKYTSFEYVECNVGVYLMSVFMIFIQKIIICINKDHICFISHFHVKRQMSLILITFIIIFLTPLGFV